ncbi:MAG TPA: CBS domain-containing protein [Chromatiaceae bacterium]|nr:CBS domain-containing protein [Chromatiaceae bacterium]HIP72507.1 CBS domain-containing protein [Anaerolineae bacterium]
MTTVNQLLQVKGNDVWSVTPSTTIFEAIKLMADMNIGALLVIENDEIVGIFSERDYARKVALLNRSSKTTPVSEIMSSPVVSVRPDQNLQKCMALMTDKHIRHLPVIDEDGQLTGIISIGDVVKAVISEQEVIINHLQDYISGVS